MSAPEREADRILVLPVAAFLVGLVAGPIVAASLLLLVSTCRLTRSPS